MSDDLFVAVDDEGKRYTIRRLRSYINTGSLAGPSRIEGLPSFVLAEGGKVNFISEDSFEIVQTGTPVHRVTP